MITEIYARQAYSDIGTIGIEARIRTDQGETGKALCAPGLAAGRHESLLPVGAGDVGPAASYINQVAAPQLMGLDAGDQRACDSVIRALDLERIGTVGAMALSEAVLRVGAKQRRLPPYRQIGAEPFRLPTPTCVAAMGSTRYGDSAAGGKPIYYFAACRYDSFSDAAYGLWQAMSAYTALLTKALGFKAEMDSEIMIPKGRIQHDEELLSLMCQAIRESGQESRVELCLDLGSDHFYHVESDRYQGILREGGYTRSEWMDELTRLCRNYPIAMLQDPLQPEDFAGFAQLRSRVPALVAAGEAVASREERLELGARQGAFDAVTVTPASVGTLSGAGETVRLARKLGLAVAIAGGHGEDVTAGDYAVGLGCDLLLGCGVSFLCNRLLEIEDELGTAARFAGSAFLERRDAKKKEGQTL